MKQFELPKEFAEKWVKALRSGEYLQGHCFLKVENGYCCLGIACKIQGIPDNKICGKNYPKDILSINPINLPDILLYEPNSRNLLGVLSEMNDIGSSFTEIADWIEDNVEFI